MKHIGIACLCLGLMACASKPVPDLTAPTLPVLFSDLAPVKAAFLSQDPFLQSLLQQALANNYALKALRHDLASAQKLTIKAKAADYPEVSINMGQSTSAADTGADLRREDKTRLALAANLAIDAWGLTDSQQHKAHLNASLALARVKAAEEQLALEVVKAYLDYHHQLAMRAALYTQIGYNEDFLSLIESRFKVGLATAVDLTQQRQALKGLNNQLLQVKTTLADIRQRLASSLSLPVDQLPVFRVAARFDGEVPGISTLDLVSRRADLQVAQMGLAMAKVDLDIAIKDSLPKLTLSLSSASEAARSVALLETWAAELAVNMTATLFDGGRRQAAADSLAEEVGAASDRYADTVLTAMNALAGQVEQLVSRHAFLAGKQDELRQSTQTLELLRHRFKLGDIDFLRVLTALNTHLNLTQAEINARFAVYQAKAQLLADTYQLVPENE